MTAAHGEGAAGGAGGAKQDLREEVWADLEGAGVARFPGARGRIPNFAGAREAAEALRGLEVWAGVEALKANPDSPQRPVRRRALEDGRTVFMAVPRLAGDHPFLRLDPDDLEESPYRASSIKGASRNGRPVDVADMPRLDLVVVGSVAVDAEGARLGKGGGYSDLEFAVTRAAGLITEATRVVTTVHERQVLQPGRIPMTAHDVPVDTVVTPERVLDCAGGHRRPAGLLWEELDEERIAAIPLLQRLAAGAGRG